MQVSDPPSTASFMFLHSHRMRLKSAGVTSRGLQIRRTVGKEGRQVGEPTCELHRRIRVPAAPRAAPSPAPRALEALGVDAARRPVGVSQPPAVAVGLRLQAVGGQQRGYVVLVCGRSVMRGIQRGGAHSSAANQRGRRRRCARDGSQQEPPAQLSQVRRSPAMHSFQRFRWAYHPPHLLLNLLNGGRSRRRAGAGRAA